MATKNVFVTRVHANGRTQIPSELRKKIGVEDGDLIAWEIVDAEARVFKAKIEKAI